MKDNSGDLARLYHIRDAILEIDDYISDINKDTFYANSMIQSACIRQLEIIGEASNRLSESILHKFDKIGWQEIIGLRNLLIHEYFGVDIKIIWQIIKNDLHKLSTEIDKIITVLEKTI